MNCTPSLPNCNRFHVLSLDKSNDICETIESVVQIPEPVIPPTIPPTPSDVPRKWQRLSKWQKRLPAKVVVAATELGPTSLRLKVELETTDTAEVKSVLSLVDSGATGDLINRDYAKSCRFKLLKLPSPIPVFNIDGTPNEAGAITEAVDLILRYKNHSERTTFVVTNLGKQKLILGHSWLRKHNPEVDWATGEVKMSRCPPRCCSGC